MNRRPHGRLRPDIYREIRSDPETIWWAPVLHYVEFGPCAGPMGPYGSDRCAGRGTPVLDCMGTHHSDRVMICRPCQDRRVDAYLAKLVDPGAVLRAAGVARWVL